jgi:hypothetical protein
MELEGIANRSRPSSCQEPETVGHFKLGFPRDPRVQRFNVSAKPNESAQWHVFATDAGAYER